METKYTRTRIRELKKTIRPGHSVTPEVEAMLRHFGLVPEKPDKEWYAGRAPKVSAKLEGIMRKMAMDRNKKKRKLLYA